MFKGFDNIKLNELELEFHPHLSSLASSCDRVTPILIND